MYLKDGDFIFNGYANVWDLKKINVVNSFSVYIDVAGIVQDKKIIHNK